MTRLYITTGMFVLFALIGGSLLYGMASVYRAIDHDIVMRMPEVRR